MSIKNVFNKNFVAGAAVGVVLAGVSVASAAQAGVASASKANIGTVGCVWLDGAEDGGFANVRLNNTGSYTAQDFYIYKNGVQVYRAHISARAEQTQQVYFTSAATTFTVKAGAGAEIFLDTLTIAKNTCNS